MGMGATARRKNAWPSMLTRSSDSRTRLARSSGGTAKNASGRRKAGSTSSWASPQGALVTSALAGRRTRFFAFAGFGFDARAERFVDVGRFAVERARRFGFSRLVAMGAMDGLGRCSNQSVPEVAESTRVWASAGRSHPTKSLHRDVEVVTLSQEAGKSASHDAE